MLLTLHSHRASEWEAGAGAGQSDQPLECVEDRRKEKMEKRTACPLAAHVLITRSMLAQALSCRHPGSASLSLTDLPAAISL